MHRKYLIDIPDCWCRPNLNLRVSACIEDPPLIRQILTDIQRREALLQHVARSAPDSKQTCLSM